MDSKEDILTSVIKHLQHIAESNQDITAETNIAEQFALDSVKVLDLIMELEDEFDISVPLNLMADVQTVDDLVDVILRVKTEQ